MRKKIFITIQNIYNILSKRRKIQSQLLILFSLLNGLLESVSIGLILVYGNIILFPEKIKNLSEKDIAENLMTSKIPNPDLVIRTSGEKRLSNFLLWQIAYSELYFTKTLWPDFNTQKYKMALKDYINRRRRFGGD